ncbi:GTP-binding protein ypt1 [Taphrina deformans PYCC 5710]|uniref:GTP-binding protein ypt1 n=1 Tax=Taphrina deformans (strain PYCC 5710 / ATCC 11124 / CBS 356.35 / IMI 108563 / JCM 9778 / NBRC 8474) TaxID=1097556 RepID=R4X8V1_TAPDE|nr:GTP-binding protein ypt1 [Taphrina deformans PYCC 5710]|eukprot:CCG82074.1 GTP-binding protein ypt1 [Taphrina deformans PYCC 5710]
MSDVETLKLLLIGNSSAGKSSLLLRFINDVWEPEDSQATIGVDLYHASTLTVKGQRVKLTIWDTAGQERFRTLTSSYYRGCQGVLVVYDVSNRASFDQIPKWFQELDTHMSSREEAGVVAFVVGNKTDRPGRLVSREDGEKVVQRVSADGYYEVSAKDGTGVDQVFLTLTEQILEKQAKTARVTGNDNVDISGAHEEQSNCAC